MTDKTILRAPAPRKVERIYEQGTDPPSWVVEVLLSPECRVSLQCAEKPLFKTGAPVTVLMEIPNDPS